ncbi:MAG: zinc ribbon domain-containing protein [Oscillospiraceae bacterium]|nr:zinc ribbon domain-containing protein [Oscillospiraceae bacterium]
MGLFSPKIPPREMEYVRGRMNQLQDSVQLVNSTVKPDVFFKRLNMTLDILLDLRSFEKYGIFKGRSPTSDYNKIIRNLEATVDDFINRALAANQQKITALKSETAKRNNYDKFVTSLIAAFDCANTFWSGSFSQTRVIPHYTGPLFRENNYRRVQALFYADDERPTYCSKCGNKLHENARFCAECGAMIKGATFENS